MKVEFTEAPPKDSVLSTIQKIRGPGAAIFSRDEHYRECVAIVQHEDCKNTRVWWVWLNWEGVASFVSRSQPMSRETAAKTLVDGGWVHQPNATMVMTKDKKGG